MVMSYPALLGRPASAPALLGGGMPAMASVSQPAPVLGGGFRNWVQNNPDTTTAIAAALMSGRSPSESFANIGQMIGPAMSADRLKRERDARVAALSKWITDQKAAGKVIPPTKVKILSAYDELAPLLAESDLLATDDTADNVSLTPFYAKDPKTGEWAMFQPTRTGQAVRVQMDGGFQPYPPGTHFADTGTSITPLDRSGAPIGSPVDKNLAEAEKQKELGTITGKNAATLPSALATGERIIAGIDDLLTDEALPSLTGGIQGWLPNVTEGAQRAQSKLDQIVGGAFLIAYDNLRGAGAITEQEGAAAKAAYTRLQNQKMGDADYQQALIEFRDEVVKLMDIARQKAGVSPSAPEPSSSAPDNSALKQKYGLE